MSAGYAWVASFRGSFINSIPIGSFLGCEVSWACLHIGNIPLRFFYTRRREEFLEWIASVAQSGNDE